MSGARVKDHSSKRSSPKSRSHSRDPIGFEKKATKSPSLPVDKDFDEVALAAPVPSQTTGNFADSCVVRSRRRVFGFLIILFRRRQARPAQKTASSTVQSLPCANAVRVEDPEMTVVRRTKALGAGLFDVVGDRVSAAVARSIVDQAIARRGGVGFANVANIVGFRIGRVEVDARVTKQDRAHAPAAKQSFAVGAKELANSFGAELWVHRGVDGAGRARSRVVVERRRRDGCGPGRRRAGRLGHSRKLVLNESSGFFFEIFGLRVTVRRFVQARHVVVGHVLVVLVLVLGHLLTPCRRAMRVRVRSKGVESSSGGLAQRANTGVSVCSE